MLQKKWCIIYVIFKLCFIFGGKKLCTWCVFVIGRKSSDIKNNVEKMNVIASIKDYTIVAFALCGYTINFGEISLITIRNGLFPTETQSRNNWKRIIAIASDTFFNLTQRHFPPCRCGRVESSPTAAINLQLVWLTTQGY